MYLMTSYAYQHGDPLSEHQVNNNKNKKKPYSQLEPARLSA